MIVGLLHPGEMGAALGASLRSSGHTVLWVRAGRSDATQARAAAAGIDGVDTLDDLLGGSEVVLSVCPPHAAVDVARSAAGYTGVYVDANAVSPATARTIASSLPRVVDGGIVGPPPSAASPTRLYLSGAEAQLAASLFAGGDVVPRIVGAEPGAASAVKMAFAAWTKGTAALLLATRAVARAEGVEEALLGEWHSSLPHLEEQWEAAARSARAKGWRWIGEMEEIADTFAAAGLPDGFHRSAAQVFSSLDLVL